MTIEHPIEDEVGQLARRVEKARGRLAYQFDPALTQALSEDELHEERDLAEKIRGQDRAQRWKQAQAAAAAADRARQTTEEIEKADIRDLLVARKAIAAQRRESSPHAKLASLYRHRSWSLRALAGVVGAGMLWSAVNVQHNIAPGGPTDPLYWFSYLIEAMISVCLIIIMIGTNKVSEWGVVDNRGQVVTAEVALLTLTVGLNTYPYVRGGQWFDAGVHAVAPVMIGVALLIHDAASARYGLAIARATDQVRDLPDPAEVIRNRLPDLATYRPMAMELGPQPVVIEAEPEPDPEPAVELSEAEEEQPTDEVEEVAAEQDDAPTEQLRVESSPAQAKPAAPAPALAAKEPAAAEAPVAQPEKRRAPAASDKAPAREINGAVPKILEGRPIATTKPEVPQPPKRPSTSPTPAQKPAVASVAETEPVKAVPPPVEKPAVKATAPASPAKGIRKVAPAKSRANGTASNGTASNGTVSKSDSRPAAATAKNGKETPAVPAKPDLQVVPAPDPIHDTGQFRIAELLEQELAELQAERRRARTSRQR
ncbi:hypothetical protein [Nocardia sp. NPDC005366]|uniref:hypothetical protein n=1 Tax=Nocardia sp. NPDC005366 TaxID=3156878 RepID=UPI0033B3C4E7